MLLFFYPNRLTKRWDSELASGHGAVHTRARILLYLHAGHQLRLSARW
jgi:hypothetical protein